MKAKSSLLTPALAFSVALALTLSWQLRQRGRGAAGASGGNAEISRPEQPRTEQRPEDALLAELRRLLRAGDLEGAREALRAAAEKSPVIAMLALQDLSYFAGADDVVADAASRLPWDGRDGSLELLDGIGPRLWRLVAWRAFLGSQSGKVSDSDLLKAMTEGREDGDSDCLQDLFEDAARQRPRAFMAELAANRDCSEDLSVTFYKAVLKAHPELMASIFDACAFTPSQRENAYKSVLEVRIEGIPDADHFQAAVRDAGMDSEYSSRKVISAVDRAYRAASPEQREGLLDLIEGQEELVRNKMLEEIVEMGDAGEIPPETMTRMVGGSSLPQQQQFMLRNWLMSSKFYVDPVKRDWIAALPTEALRAEANNKLDQDEADASEGR
jgi:hypothetical protein